MVKFRLDEAFVDAGSGTPGNRSVWDMLFPRMLLFSLIGFLFERIYSLVKFS